MSNIATADCQAETEGVSEGVLVAQAQAGDDAAFEELIRRHEAKAHRLAEYLCRNAADGQEAAQTALLKAYLHLKDFRGESKFSSWLTRIVVRECGQRLRSRRRNATRWQSLDEEFDEERMNPAVPVAASDNPEEECVRREFQEFLQSCLAGMGDIYRIPFILGKVRGLSNQEIADRLGLTLPALKSRLLRARRQLQRCLKAKYCPPGGCYWPGTK